LLQWAVTGSCHGLSVDISHLFYERRTAAEILPKMANRICVMGDGQSFLMLNNMRDVERTRKGPIMNHVIGGSLDRPREGALRHGPTCLRSIFSTLFARGQQRCGLWPPVYCSNLLFAALFVSLVVAAVGHCVQRQWQ